MSSSLVALAALVLAAAACVQSTVGFGFALISAPVLALFSNELVPGPLLAASCALSTAAALREHGAIDRRGVAFLLIGRLPGALIGGVLLGALAPRQASVLFGGFVLLGVALTTLGLSVPRGDKTFIAIGLLSGVMGTTAAVGGPPVALVYQDATGAALRSTLNAYFACGALLSIAVLACSGQFGLADLGHAAWMLPSVAVGFALSARARSVLDGGRTRTAVLLVAGGSAIAVIAKALWFG
jgi:uncharacterized membrane protein YfcA